MALVMLMGSGLKSYAAVNWQFQVGGILSKRYGANGDFLNDDGKFVKSTAHAFKGAILLQISLGKTSPLWIETGLAYRNSYVLYVSDDYSFKPKEADSDFLNKLDGYQGNYLELPVKAMYKLTLNNKSAIDFGFGPYVSSVNPYPNGETWSVGLNLSVAYRYRCMSYGIEWQNPVFMNGPRNYYKNDFLITIGINLKGRSPNMEKIAAVLDATGTVLDTVNSTLYGDSSDSGYDAGGYSDSSNSIGTSSSTGNYQTMYDNWARRAEANYNSLTNLGYDAKSKSGKHSGSSGSGKVSGGNYVKMKKSLREAQKEMSKIRQKAAKNGVHIQKSQWEDATVSY